MSKKKVNFAISVQITPEILKCGVLKQPADKSSPANYYGGNNSAFKMNSNQLILVRITSKPRLVFKI